ncbi:MAG TPA: hypothetical protein PLR98_07215, partial [Chitinophagaceae bacterium]|nr:hypothetical protein [Chitinophagaceae bacterium]
YWKNGVKVDLSPANPGHPSDAEAYDIILMGNDVYACGYEYTAAGKYRAVYWKNGTANYLTNGSTDAAAFALTSFGSDVYVCGYETNAAGIQIAKYWKNGTAFNVTNGTYNAILHDIAVTNSDVYVLGR